MARKLHILALEPYYGGSHRAFLDTLVAHSRHHFTVLTMPARKWKWRMRGSSIWFAREPATRQHPPPDLILATDMVAVADLRALAGGLAGVPLLLYFHENQLTYPVLNEADRDFQYGFTNITSGLAADAVWFNSAYHREAFLSAATALLARMPDFVPDGIVARINARARVMYPLIETAGLTAGPRRFRTPGAPLRILWNHRWEYDKNPEPFFAAMIRLAEAGLDFRLVVAGETFREAPPVFAESWDRLAGRLDQAGYVPTRRAYLELLAGCDVVVSTAIQENFGIAVVEAMAAGCRPLLPRRLSYPELIPPEFHAACLYDEDAELERRLAELIASEADVRLGELQAAVSERFSATRQIGAYDEAFVAIARAGTG